MKTIKFDIDPTGTRVQVDAAGYQAKSCTEATKKIIESLTGKESKVSTHCKPEMNMLEPSAASDMDGLSL